MGCSFRPPHSGGHTESNKYIRRYAVDDCATSRNINPRMALAKAKDKDIDSDNKK
ncbi:MAG: hypothetical protein WC340_08595 [Kiritimatiellia bacterium]